MRRLAAMIVKETWALLRDPKARIILILPPLVELAIFAFAATLEVSNVDVGVLDRSNGVHSAELIQRIDGSPNFRKIVPLGSIEELRRAVDRRQIIAALVIEPDFDRLRARGEPARIGVVLDGRRSNAAQVVAGYLSRIAAGADTQLARRDSGGGVIVTHWFNPSLDYIWFTLPSLIAIIVAVSGLSITSQTVARERELGTFDQLLVSPIRQHEILIGKIIPPMVVGMLNGVLYLMVAPLIFHVPMNGSILLFLLSLIVYLLALSGIGLIISGIARTQQQAFLGSFVVMNPLMLLSGFTSPIENMPGWLQMITYLNPARYFLNIVQGLFLKAMPVADVLHQLWPLGLIGVVTLSTSVWLFRARME